MFKVILTGTVGGIVQKVSYDCERYKFVNNDTLKLSSGETHLFVDLKDVLSYTITTAAELTVVSE